MDKTLIISNTSELYRLYPDDIVFIQADRNYSEIIMSNGDVANVTLQLGVLVDIIDRQLHTEQPQFIRLGRSYIINLKYIYHIRLNPAKLWMKSRGGKIHEVPKVAHEALVKLIALVESEIQNYQEP